MSRRAVGYWIVTGVLAAAFVLGGVVDLTASPDVVAFMAHLGYPGYFARLLGSWKVAGGLALLAPRFPRLKEWAYAGIVFDLTGAVVSHAATGDGVPHIVLPIAMVGLAFASWSLRPESRKLAGVSP